MKTLYLCASLLIVLLAGDLARAQQNDLEKGIALYNQNDAAGAVRLLKSSTKADSTDARAWYYLGLAYLKQDKKKDAAKALEKAVALNGRDAKAHTGLAYVSLLRNDADKARSEALAALAIDPKIAEAHYILGVQYARDAIYNSAYEAAKKALALNPKLAQAYLLKSESLVSSFAVQSGTVMKPRTARGEMLDEAVADLEQYLSLAPPNEETDFYREYLASLKFFADYYGRIDDRPLTDEEAEKQTPVNRTPLKILSKPKAEYTAQALDANISGVARLLVGFSADGKVEHILVIRPLGFGLDREAVRAARGIKFEPATRDGQKVPSVRMVEYSFAIRY